MVLCQAGVVNAAFNGRGRRATEQVWLMSRFTGVVCGAKPAQLVCAQNVVAGVSLGKRSPSSPARVVSVWSHGFLLGTRRCYGARLASLVCRTDVVGALPTHVVDVVPCMCTLRVANRAWLVCFRTIVAGEFPSRRGLCVANRTCWFGTFVADVLLHVTCGWLVAE